MRSTFAGYPIRLGILEQPQVSNHLGSLRWCDFVEARREGRTVSSRVADEPVEKLLELGLDPRAARAAFAFGDVFAES